MNLPHFILVIVVAASQTAVCGVLRYNLSIDLSDQSVGSPKEKELPTLAILAFENQSGRTNNDRWGNAIQLLLSSSLEKSKAVAVLRDVDDAAKQMQDSDLHHDHYKATLGHMIGARYVICGAYSLTDTNCSVSVELIDVNEGATPCILNATAKNWFVLCDTVDNWIIDQVKITLTDIQKQHMLEHGSTSPFALDLLCQSRAQAAQGDWAAAEKLVRIALQLDAHSSEAHGLLAGFQAQHNDFYNAETNARQCVLLDTNGNSGQYLLGCILLSRGKFAEAEYCLRQAATIDKFDPDPLVRLGYLFELRGQLIAAQDWYEQSLLFDPFSTFVHLRLAELHYQLLDTERSLSELPRVDKLRDEDEISKERALLEAYAREHYFVEADKHGRSLLGMLESHHGNSNEIEEVRARLANNELFTNVHYLSASRPLVFTDKALKAALERKLSVQQLNTVHCPFERTRQMDMWAAEITRETTNDWERATKLFDALNHRYQGSGFIVERNAKEVF